MAYKFKYNERPRSYSEEKHGDEDIPSAKAVRDTAVEERDGKIIKSRRQHVCGREYIVFAEFSFGTELPAQPRRGAASGEELL